MGRLLPTYFRKEKFLDKRRRSRKGRKRFRKVLNNWFGGPTRLLKAW